MGVVEALCKGEFLETCERILCFVRVIALTSRGHGQHPSRLSDGQRVQAISAARVRLLLPFPCFTLLLERREEVCKVFIGDIDPAMPCELCTQAPCC